MDFQREIEQGKKVAQCLRAGVLNAGGNKELAKKFTQGGYQQSGYGVAEGAANDGSHAMGDEGNQGYYVNGGREIFLGTVAAMQRHIQSRAAKNGKPIRCVIKCGIGGQHTPFQGIASVFDAAGTQAVFVTGEYELGKDFSLSLQELIQKMKIDWNQLLVIPSSKSGSTDETMLVFTDILYVLLNQAAEAVLGPCLKHAGVTASVSSGDDISFAEVVFDVLHDVNFIQGKERPGAELFSVTPERFDGINNLIDLIAKRLPGISREAVKDVFARVLGNMFFETTDNKAQSRLAAFIHNSGLGRELGADAPGFGAMFDNVGGRWTGDLHMMAFLAAHFPDLQAAEKYYERRKAGISRVREGKHAANALANRILNEGGTDIALLVPDALFWFGKSIEQNFNESIWQSGLVNVVTVRESDWSAQKVNYENIPGRFLINLTAQAYRGAAVPAYELGAELGVPAEWQDFSAEEITLLFAELFTFFYGLTNTTGTRLIARAVAERGLDAGQINMSDLDNPATRVVQKELFLRQPFVELGKGFLQQMLEKTQTEKDGVRDALEQAIAQGKSLFLESNLPGAPTDFAKNILWQIEFAREQGRKFVPFIYLEGEKFYGLRDALIQLGVEWVMQGTGDQHISYQQVLTCPDKYLPLLISFVPENAALAAPGRPAIGFAKGYLHQVSPHLVRHLFAAASYWALREQGGLGSLWTLPDTEKCRQEILQAHEQAKKNVKSKIIAFKSGRIELKSESFVSIDVRIFENDNCCGVAPAQVDLRSLPKTSSARLYDAATRSNSFALDGYPALKEGKTWQERLKNIIEQQGALDMTTNQTLLRKLVESGAMDERIGELARQGKEAAEIYTALYTETANQAAAIFTLVQRQWPAEGRVSQEASALITEYVPLVEAVEKIHQGFKSTAGFTKIPNIGGFTKVPNIEVGPAAVRAAIRKGVNVNVTLLFSDLHYLDTAEAYVRGLADRVEDLRAAGKNSAQISQDIKNIFSVNSLFVSRTDRTVDPMLDQAAAANPEKAPALKALKGKTAVAYAKLVYRMYQAIFDGVEFRDPENLFDAETKKRLADAGKAFQALAALGANAQRLLIASTGVKEDQPYHPLLYVLSFFGKGVHNTMPEGTLFDVSRFTESLSDEQAAGLRLRSIITESLPAGEQHADNKDAWLKDMLAAPDAGQRISADQVIRRVQDWVLTPAATDLHAIGKQLRDKGALDFKKDEEATVEIVGQRASQITASVQ